MNSPESGVHGHLRPIRVLHITFNMGIGGTEQVIRQLIEGTGESDAAAEILCIDGKVGPIGEALQSRGIPVHSVARAAGLDRSLIREIRTLIKSGEFDIIHCHQYTPYFYGWLGALGTRAKVVFTEHGRFHPDRHRYKAFLFNAIAARCTAELVAISEATREALVEYEFMPRARIQVIYNGIRPLTRNEGAVTDLRQRLGIGEQDFVMGTVARLDPVKNQTMMLEAFCRFHQRFPDSWLLMVGDGPDRQMLQQLAMDLDIARRTIFTGFINEPANHLSVMDVFLLSSHTEGTSMTLLEAMSLGIPSVVTEVGGNPEIIRHRENGLLAPASDAEQFCEAMAALYDDGALRHRLKKGALRVFEDRFSASAMVSHYMDVYRRHASRAPLSQGEG